MIFTKDKILYPTLVTILLVGIFVLYTIYDDSTDVEKSEWAYEMTQIRDMNKDVKIIARCFEEDLASILEKQFNVETISTSKFAAERIEKQVKTIETKEINGEEQPDYLIIGLNHISERLGRKFKNVGKKFKIIDIPNYA